MTVKWVRKIHSDEKWNGWPDITQWNGTYYICFSSGSFHGARDHKILLTSSNDLESWSLPEVVLGPPGDHLESFFLETIDRLFIQASWRNEDEPVHTDVVSSTDGVSWGGRKQAFRDRYIFWGQNERDGRYYVAAHIDPPTCENYLVVSPDGDAWSEVSLINDDRTTETDLCFLKGGELLSFSRRSPRDFLLACSSKPPYTKWDCRKTDTVLEGAAVSKIADRIVAIGRCSEFEGLESIDRWYDRSRRTGIFFYEDGKFTRQAYLPSGGDTGYPGILVLDGASALIVYYSEHEKMDSPDFKYKHCGAIYLALIEISSGHE